MAGAEGEYLPFQVAVDVAVEFTRIHPGARRPPAGRRSTAVLVTATGTGPGALDTSTHTNVQLYSRLGFDTKAELAVAVHRGYGL